VDEQQAQFEKSKWVQQICLRCSQVASSTTEFGSRRAVAMQQNGVAAECEG